MMHFHLVFIQYTERDMFQNYTKQRICWLVSRYNEEIIGWIPRYQQHVRKCGFAQKCGLTPNNDVKLETWLNKSDLMRVKKNWHLSTTRRTFSLVLSFFQTGWTLSADRAARHAFSASVVSGPMFAMPSSSGVTLRLVGQNLDSQERNMDIHMI